MRLQDKVCIITGGAAGIGKATAVKFAAEGAKVVICDVNEEAGKTLAEELGNYASFWKVNVVNRQEVQAWIDAVAAKYGRIDVLINNAGIVIGKYIHEMGYEDIKRTLDINFIGGAYLSRLVLPDMMKRNKGFIVNIASAMGLTGVPRMGDYCASKHAIIGFNDSLRMELKKFKCNGVKTLVVCPSAIDTGMFAGYKAPFCSPLLQPEAVARKTLDAIKKERPYLKLPFIVRVIPSMKLFPAAIQDIMGKLTGLEKSMDHFHGKGKPTARSLSGSKKPKNLNERIRKVFKRAHNLMERLFM